MRSAQSRDAWGWVVDICPQRSVVQYATTLLSLVRLTYATVLQNVVYSMVYFLISPEMVVSRHTLPDMLPIRSLLQLPFPHNLRYK
jgi:hypothetical protein